MAVCLFMAFGRRDNPIIDTDPLGLLKVCRRPLSFAGDYMSSGATGTNLGIFHEHAFYEDGTGDNTGFTKTGLFDDRKNINKYQCGNTRYDDKIMWQAEANKANDWKEGYNFVTNNCHDYIEVV
ncbi:MULTISPECIES: hypothetical protein [unclassified Endozoicomonas]|uniref:hypothetical protein n=1 Tax=unclassified Endozoicomonas TaxID=2644528 RepID=UPI003BB7B000